MTQYRIKIWISTVSRAEEVVEANCLSEAYDVALAQALRSKSFVTTHNEPLMMGSKVIEKKEGEE